MAAGQPFSAAPKNFIAFLADLDNLKSFETMLFFSKIDNLQFYV